MDLLEKIKRFSLKQIKNEIDSNVSFEFDGKTIVDPWIDKTGRHILSNDDAFYYYGPLNMLGFIEDALEALSLNNDSDYPPEGELLVSLKMKNGHQVEIWKHGRNDYAACFPSDDCSVRGTLEDIADEISDTLPFPGTYDSQPLVGPWRIAVNILNGKEMYQCFNGRAGEPPVYDTEIFAEKGFAIGRCKALNVGLEAAISARRSLRKDEQRSSEGNRQ